MKLFIYNDDLTKQWIVIKDDKPVMTAGYQPEELQKLGRFMAKTIMTESKRAVDNEDYKGTQDFINSLGNEAMPCEHANENPVVCNCKSECYCCSHTCKDKKRST